LKKLSIILSLFIFLSADAQNTFVVWQGFSNHWTYNHRLNRLGDFISQSSENTNEHYTLTHTAATGLGKDSAYFQSNYAIVQSNDVGFFAGKINFNLKGKEGNNCIIKKNLEFHPSVYLERKEIYTAILNGFDITSVADADKLKVLKIDIGDPVYENQTNTLRFTITVTLNTDCKSIECDWFTDEFNYNLDIRYLILAANKDEISCKHISYKKKTIWNKDVEIKPVSMHQSTSTDPVFANGFLAYKSISIYVDHEQHYLDFENTIDSVSFNQQTNTLNYSMNLFYSNWKENMKQSAASGRQAMFAYRSEGWCVMQGELNLIQFKSGTIVYKTRKGSIYWQGKNKTAFDDAAMNAQTILK